MYQATSYQMNIHQELLAALDSGIQLAKSFEPRGLSDIEVRPNGERVAVIDSGVLNP